MKLAGPVCSSLMLIADGDNGCCEAGAVPGVLARVMPVCGVRATLPWGMAVLAAPPGFVVLMKTAGAAAQGRRAAEAEGEGVLCFLGRPRPRLTGGAALAASLGALGRGIGVLPFLGRPRPRLTGGTALAVALGALGRGVGVLPFRGRPRPRLVGGAGRAGAAPGLACLW